MNVDPRSAYLVVIRSAIGTEEWQGINIASVRCNRPDTAQAVAAWFNERSDATAKVFSDAPQIGQFS